MHLNVSGKIRPDEVHHKINLCQSGFFGEPNVDILALTFISGQVEHKEIDICTDKSVPGKQSQLSERK